MVVTPHSWLACPASVLPSHCPVSRLPHLDGTANYVGGILSPGAALSFGLHGSAVYTCLDPNPLGPGLFTLAAAFSPRSTSFSLGSSAAVARLGIKPYSWGSGPFLGPPALKGSNVPSLFLWPSCLQGAKPLQAAMQPPPLLP